MRTSAAFAVAIVSVLIGAFSLEGARLRGDAPEPSAPSVLAAPLLPPGGVLSVREVELREGADPAAFERFVTEELTPTFQEHAPGLEVYVLKGDRGLRKSRYLLVYAFDSVATRDAYVPEEGGALSDDQPEVQRLAQQFTERFGTFAVMEGIADQYTDYAVLD